MINSLGEVHKEMEKYQEIASLQVRSTFLEIGRTEFMGKGSNRLQSTRVTSKTYIAKGSIFCGVTLLMTRL